MADGDTLWAWQSQEPDGRWSVIAMFTATEQEAMSASVAQLARDGRRLLVLVHRDREIAEGWGHFAVAHYERYGQPVRFVRFDLAGEPLASIS